MTDRNQSNTRPTAIDLFSGVGGMSLGFEQAGFDVVAAVEVDPIHAAAHKYNFPRCATLARSVVGLSAKELLTAAGLDAPPDVVFGGAPCQGFSLMGQRAFDDPRNALVKEFLRIVTETRASYFVFENVKGLTVGKHRDFLDELIAEFRSHGYDVRMKWRVLNAKDFGVPQSRERLILIGARKGIELPDYPDASDHSPTCRDAISDLPDAEAFDELMANDAVRVEPWIPSSEYAREMRGLSNYSWHSGYPRKWDPSLLTASMRTSHTGISRRRFKSTKPGEVEPISRFFKLHPEGVSNTLRAGTDSARGAFTSPRPIHYEHARCVTVREMARLHGFPDWFRFHVTKWHGARQIGNAVPPPLARAIALKIAEVIGVQSVPNEPIELGSEELLSLTMAQAADFFGIEIPIGRRDRKSGARKRKQEEIEAALRAAE